MNLKYVKNIIKNIGYLNKTHAYFFQIESSINYYIIKIVSNYLLRKNN